MLSLMKFYLNKRIFDELCQNIVGSGFLRETVKSLPLLWKPRSWF